MSGPRIKRAHICTARKKRNYTLIAVPKRLLRLLSWRQDTLVKAERLADGTIVVEPDREGHKLWNDAQLCVRSSLFVRNGIYRVEQEGDALIYRRLLE